MGNQDADTGTDIASLTQMLTEVEKIEHTRVVAERTSVPELIRKSHDTMIENVLEIYLNHLRCSVQSKAMNRARQWIEVHCCRGLMLPQV